MIPRALLAAVGSVLLVTAVSAQGRPGRCIGPAGTLRWHFNVDTMQRVGAVARVW